MKKRRLFTILILAALMIFTLCACGQKDAVDIDIEEGAEQVEVITAEQIVGDWAEETAGRANMTIAENEDGTFAIEIYWSSSAAEADRWTMTGSIDEEDVVYSNCLHERFVWNEDGEEESRTVISENSCGEFELDDNGKLEWDSEEDSESDNEEVVFVRSK